MGFLWDMLASLTHEFLFPPCPNQPRLFWGAEWDYPPLQQYNHPFCCLRLAARKLSEVTFDRSLYAHTGLYFFNNFEIKASRSDDRPALIWLITLGDDGTSGMILCNALGEFPGGFEEAVCWRETWAEGCRLAIFFLHKILLLDIYFSCVRITPQLASSVLYLQEQWSIIAQGGTRGAVDQHVSGSISDPLIPSSSDHRAVTRFSFSGVQSI